MRPVPLLLLLTVVISLAFPVQAQIPGVSKGAIPGGANIGQLLTQFVNALKPSSFTDAFKGEKSSFLANAAKASSPASIAQSIGSLAGFIKPGLFKSASLPQSIEQSAGQVKTMSGAASLLQTLEGGLKPEAFVSSWAAHRGAWLSALNLLKGK